MSKKSEEKNTAIGNVKEREIVEEMKDSYIDYAMSVIVARALPDVRDGLKPVHRRILYAMNEMGLSHAAKFRKSATIVGETMGKYHPHGDTAIYDSLVRMAQDFSLRYPLVEGQGNFGCFTADTKVKLTDNRNLSFKELIKEHLQGKNNFTFTISDDRKIKIAEIKNPRKTRENAEIMKVVLDNGEEIKCTPNHKFMLKNGLYKNAKDLKMGDSLMPLYSRFSTEKDNPNAVGYNMVFQPGLNLWDFVHVISDNWNIENNIYKKSNGKIRHHVDFNKLNNNPDNIRRIQWKEHWQTHYNFTSTKHKEDAAYRLKLDEGRKKFWAKQENKEAYSERMRQRNLENWRDSDYREKMRVFLSEVNRRYIKEHPEIIKIMSERASKTLKRLWAIPEYRRLFHDKIVDSNKRRVTNLTGKKKFVNICRYLQEHGFLLNKENFEKTRKETFGTKSFTSWDLGIEKYYGGNCELVLFELNRNHKVNRTELLKESADVYDLTIDETHNFALASGVFVHNSIDGDPPSAMRYSEAKLSQIGEEMLKDIEKETVNFSDNYDGTHKEPQVLPSPAPQLLLNGSLGIAVGMATNIPPHNLTELLDALIYLIEHPKTETSDLFQFIQGPDFPTGGIIYDQKEIISAYSQGKGPIIIRGKADIVEKGEGNTQIIITEIPYQVQKSDLVMGMANLVSEKKIDGIRDIKDLSDREGMRIVIDIKKGFQPQRVLNRLYKFTNLQKIFYLNMLALVDGIQPKILSLAEVLYYFLLHKKEVVTRRTQYDLEKAKERAHILEGLVIALKKIDVVIATIKKSKDREDAKKNLMKKFKLTEKQAVAILEMKLQTLAGLERKKIDDELKEVLGRIKEFSSILKSPEKLKNLIKKELQELKEKYGDKRRTKVVKQKLGEITEVDLVPLEETIITLTRGGYIKRINPTTYKIQKRGGKGMVGMKTMGDDIVEHFLSASTHDNLLFFTDSGKLFQTQAYEIPEGTRVARGRGLLNFLELSTEEKVLELLPLKKEEAGKFKYLVMVTKNGKIKKTCLEDFKNVRKSGIIAIKLVKGDLLKKVVKTTGEDEIILTTKKGIAIRFKEKDIRPMGRAAAGVKGINLKKGDEVIGMDVIESSKLSVKGGSASGGKIQNQLLVVMENGYGKRTDIKQYKTQGRGGSGIKTAQITSKTGELILAKVLTGEEEDLIVISQKGNVIRSVINSISVLGRATQGVRIMRLDEGDKVASGTCI